MKALFNAIFGNPEQDRIIERFATLNRALQSNTREQCEFYLAKLKTL